MDGFQQAPFFGLGIRHFKGYHQSYINTHQVDMEDRYPKIERDIANPHSVYVGLLFAYGLVGTLLLCATLIQATRGVLRSGELFLLCLILFYFGSGIVDYPLHRKDGTFLLFFPLGLFFGKQLITTQRAAKNVTSGQLLK